MVFLWLLLIIPHLGIYLQHCGKPLVSFTQVQRLERFLRQVHFLPIEALETLLVRPKVYPLERTVGLQNVVPKDVRFALMFQKYIFLNPFRQRVNIRLTITSIEMINV